MSSRAASRAKDLTWRKICAALPAVALIGAGVAFAAPFAPGHGIVTIALTNQVPSVVVPDRALTVAADAPRGTNPFPSDVPEAPLSPQPSDSAPALTASKVAQLGTSVPVALDSTGIPVRALEAYRAAASMVGAADPACHVDWALLAAFGRVESNHARFGGNQLDSAGVAQPGIIGIPLDGSNGTARIPDSDGGSLDGDTVYDRAVGPMQFIPSTWRAVGVDADGDGVKNPQDIADAVTATAIYVCSGPGDLSRPSDLHAAIMRYNNSDSYARTVTAIAAAYRLRVVALPSFELLAATSASPSRATPARRTPAPPVQAAPAVRAARVVRAAPAVQAAPAPAPAVQAAPAPAPAPAPAIQAAPAPAPAPAPPAPAPAPAPPVQAELVPAPAAPQSPALQTPAQPAPVSPVPAAPAPMPADACPLTTPPTGPPPSDPVTPVDPTTTKPCVPPPCVPTPTNPDGANPNPADPQPTQPPALSAPLLTPGTEQTCTTVPPDLAPIPAP